MTNTDKFQMKTAQFKRGLKSVLEARLVANDLGVLLAGEPAFETDTGQVKVGNGVSSYKDLPYVGTDIRLAINDPVDNQILIYDSTLQKWVNKDLADEESIIYLAKRGLTIKGYDAAKQGYMLVKDDTDGLTWVKPLDSTQLQQSVAAAEAAKNTANTYSTQAGNYAAAANTSAQQANRINQQTMNFVNNKFWWGSMEEYNALTSIDPGTFYFIKSAN